MEWSNLKVNKCPKCGYQLMAGLLDSNYKCKNRGCRFSISEAKFTEIISDMYKGKMKFPLTDNAEGLNNLGHEKVTEGFDE